jgi:anti-sigma factor RsiW
MKRQQERHYTEEDLLMHLLGEETPNIESMISDHLPECRQCHAAYTDLQSVVKDIHSWAVEYPPEESWQLRKAQMMEILSRDKRSFQSRGVLGSLARIFQSAWDYALENPIPAMCYVVVVIAFASERAIDVFRLHSVLPAASQVIELLTQVL